VFTTIQQRWLSNKHFHSLISDHLLLFLLFLSYVFLFLRYAAFLVLLYLKDSGIIFYNHNVIFLKIFPFFKNGMKLNKRFLYCDSYNIFCNNCRPNIVDCSLSYYNLARSIQSTPSQSVTKT